MRVSVIIPAAGASSRMNARTRKPFLKLDGVPVLWRVCARFKALPEVREIILVSHPEDLERVQGEWWDELSARGATLAVAGGENRAESVWRGLEVSAPEAELVAVHDAARPFFSRQLCELLFRTAAQRGAAIPILPLADTVKRIEVDKVMETVRRQGLMRVQTPQVFRRNLLVEANEYALSSGGFSDRITDDASLVEAYGREVAAVMGEENNLKITTSRDLRLAELMLKEGWVRE